MDSFPFVTQNLLRKWSETSYVDAKLYSIDSITRTSHTPHTDITESRAPSNSDHRAQGNA